MMRNLESTRCRLGRRVLAALLLTVVPGLLGLTTHAASPIQWTYQTDYYIWNAPAIGEDGTIYFGCCAVSCPNSSCGLYALEPNGTLKWVAPAGDQVYSEPAIAADGTIYFGSRDEHLYAIDPNGHVKWQFKALDGIDSSPAVGEDGTIYFGSADGHLYALTPAGQLKWKYETGGEVYSSPAIGRDGTIYFGSYDTYVYALSPSGSLKWKYKTNDQVAASPAIGQGGTVYITSWDGHLYALRPNGTLQWSFKADGTIHVYSCPAVGRDGTVYFGANDGHLYALSPAGQLKWKYKTGGAVYSSPAIGANEVIYFGARDSHLYALNWDGSLRWKLPVGGDVDDGPALSDDGILYFGCWDRQLYAVKTDSQGIDRCAPWPMLGCNTRHTARSDHEGGDCAQSLPIEIELSEEVITDGSAEILIRLPPDPMEEAILLIDDQTVNEGKPLPFEFTLNALNFADGWHRIAVWAVSQDGRLGWAETWVYIQNPSVSVRSFAGPEIIWPDAEVVFVLETEGSVTGIHVDLSSLCPQNPPDATIEQIDDDHFQVSFRLPYCSDSMGIRHQIPVHVYGADSDELLFNGIDVLFIRAEPLPLGSSQGILMLPGSLPLESEGDASARIVDVEPELVLEQGGESSYLHVTVEGDIEGAELVLSSEEYGGYLAVPLAGLEPIEQMGESVYVYAIALQASQKAKPDVFVDPGLYDKYGVYNPYDYPILTGTVEMIPDYSVKGMVQHEFKDSSGSTTTGLLDGCSLQVLDKNGTTVASGVVAWTGEYFVKLATPNPADLPYSIELRTEEPEGEVVSAAPHKVHVYKHNASIESLTYGEPYELNITVPLAQSGAFHIFRVLRRANDWYRKKGMPLGKTTVVWSKGVTPPCGTSCHIASTGKIYFLGSSDDPDEYDDSVIVHEIGHRATWLHSSVHSPSGLQHSRWNRYVATLAWSEGIATYLGQTILQNPKYVDTYAGGTAQYYIDDMSGVPTGTADGTESGDLSEGLVAALLWDLNDPVSPAQHDNVSGLGYLTLKSFWAMKNTSNLDRGIKDKADLADFVKLTGCGLGSSQKDDMHTLLSKRFALGWLKATGFCK